jgi:hypothetical protein
MAHSGAYGVKMITTAPPESAVRMFRWEESLTDGSLCYSTAYYFSRNYSIGGYWSIPLLEWRLPVEFE